MKACIKYLDFGCAVFAGVWWIRMGFCRLIRRSMCDVYVINIYMFNSFVCISHSLYVFWRVFGPFCYSLLARYSFRQHVCQAEPADFLDGAGGDRDMRWLNE